MNREQIIASARKAAAKKEGIQKVEAQPTTDAQGTPEIGGAPTDEAVEKPSEEGTPEAQIKDGAAATDAAATAPAAEAPAAPAAAPGLPEVKIADESAVALVKLRDNLSTMKSDVEMKTQVIKETEKMLEAAGIPVTGMQKFFDARAAAMAGRIPSGEVKRHMGIVAKAQNLAKVIAAETDLGETEAEELAGIKASLETAIEKAQDALTAVAEQKPGNHRNIVVEALRDIELASKEYGYWKKALSFKDAVADTICAVAEFIETRKIAATASEIVREFDELVSMSDKERKNAKSYRMGANANNASIRTIAAMSPAAAADPLAEIEQLAKKAIESEIRVDKV